MQLLSNVSCILLTFLTEQYDYSLLQRYVTLFPQLPLAKFIIIYFEFSGLPLEDDVDEKSKPLVPNNTEDKFYDLLVRPSTISHDRSLTFA
jgi:hypothetical protein